MDKHLILPVVTWRQNMAEYTMVNPLRDVKNGAINVKSVAII
jgi:hypothetical protein